MWINYNANPDGVRGIDCTVRAISVITGDSWDATYVGIALEGLLLKQMPSANAVWGSYLERRGYRRSLPPPMTTVRQFCEDNPMGDYVLALSGHVVAVKDGNFLDTWDSGDEIVIYYWEKE